MRRRLTDLAKRKGAKWHIPGTGILVIQDNHPTTPYVANQQHPKSRWIMHYCDLQRLGTPLEDDQ